MASAPIPRETAREVEDWLRGLARPVRPVIAAAIALGIAGAALLVAQTALVASIVADAVDRPAGIASLMPRLGALLPIVVARAIAAALGDATAFEAGARVVTEVRGRLVRHLAAAGPAAMTDLRSGTVASTLSDGAEALARYYSGYLPQRRLAVAVPLAILAAVACADWVSALLMGVAAPLIPLFMVLIGRGTDTLNRRQWRRLARLSGQLFDSIEGLATLRAFGAGRRETARIAAASEEYREATMSVLRVAFLSSLALEFCATLGVAIVAVFVGFRLYARHLAFEPGLFALLLAPEFFRPLRAMGTQYHARMEAIGAAESLRTLLRLPSDGGTGRRALPASPVVTLRVENVHFAYDQSPVLAGLDFTLRRGERAALVGASGSGKSTVAKLLLGFHSPASGRILIGGTQSSGLDLADLGREDWLRRVGWLPQRPTLFLGTLRDNVRLGLAGADDDAVVGALEAAGAGALLARLPLGLDAPIGDRGQGLSGGEAQRVALARLFLKDAEVVVIDEAAAGLDADTAALVDAAIRRLSPRCAMLTIAHRLESVRDADAILVLERGRIVEQGRHSDLLARDGAYAALVHAGMTGGAAASKPARAPAAERSPA